MQQSSKTNLLDFDRQGLEAFFAAWGEPAYRAHQVLKWVHEYGYGIEKMTNLSKSLREKLTELTDIVVPEIAYEKQSDDGTFKWLLRLADGNQIETVFIPEKGRGTLCVSSQVGCALNCQFCSTATQGFNRNLTVAEIIGQVFVAVRRLSTQEGRHDRKITNVVMMGMGEPLLNFDNVVTAMNIMMDDFAYGLAKRRVTLSTSGLVPDIYRLRDVSDVALAISLHAPTDELRDELVPINRKYPLAELLRACKDYFPKAGKRRITFEYVMLAGVNDSPKQAQLLAKLLQGIPAKVNLIPFNPFPNTRYERSSDEVIYRFQQIISKAGIVATIRKTRGDDIDAACGQLVGDFNDKTKRRERLNKKIGILIQAE